MGDDSTKELMKFIKEQQEEMRAQREAMEAQIKAQNETIAQLTKGIVAKQEDDDNKTTVAVISPRLMSDLSSRVASFRFDPESGFTFSKWFERYGDVFVVDGAMLDDKARVRLLLEKLEEDVFGRYKRQILPKETSEVEFEETVKILKEMFDIKTSVFTTRYHCLKLEKLDNEDYMQYTGRVNEQCHRAKIHELDSDGLKALLWINGLRSSKDADIRHRLLTHLDHQANANEAVTLHDLYKETEKWNSLKRDSQLIEGSTRMVREVKASRSSHHSRTSTSDSECWNCGKPGHRSARCNSKKWRCGKCKKEGHKDAYCERLEKYRGRSQSRGNGFQAKKKSSARINQIVVIGKTEADVAGVNAVRKYMEVKVNGRPVQFQVDTGSDITLLNQAEWETMGRPTMSDSDITVVDASGGTMSILGKLKCDFETSESKGSGYAYVTPRSSLMGLSWITQCEAMSYHLEQMIVSQVSHDEEDLAEALKKKYPEVFEEGLGRCTKEKAEMTLLPNAVPKFCPKRPVAYAAKETVEKELDRLIEMDVIEPVTHSKWAAPIVCVKKSNGKLRVCADFSTGLNVALQDHEYPLPIPEDIFASLNGGTVFTQIDFSDAYLQVELTDDAQQLVVINTHRGLYRYKRLPFGIKTAPATFQQLMHKMCAGLRGVASYLDDVLVVGRTVDEHNKNVMALFERIAEYGFRVRLEKCSFKMSQIPFLGFIVDRNGRKPSPEKVKVIKNMKEPENESQLRAFMGMITYYGNFIPQMRSLRGPLDRLLAKDVEWKWTEKERVAFEKLKDVMSSEMNLTHYDPAQQVVVAADASEYGIGAVISHRFQDGSEKPICHAAKSLSPAERNYSQIEKEALGLIFAITKFHKYVYGRKFTLLTDHKPLLAIFGSKKGVPVQSANRLMRWATKLLGYDFEIQYVNTLKFGQADGLSRMIQSYPTEEEDLVVAHIECDVQAVFGDAVRRIPATAEDVRTETHRDPILRRVIKCVRNDTWPKTVDDKLKAYYNRRATLCVVEGCLMSEHRVVIPEELRRKVLKELHVGHPGIVRMKGLARSVVYWPNLDQDCEDVVRRCANCQESQKSPTKVPLQTWSTPKRVWERVHIDFAGPMEGMFYFVVVDSLSKWPEIIPMKTISAKATVRELTTLFARYGMPETIVSDNGTQFTSTEFATMCEARGIRHMRTAPYHPQSNGQAERFVDILKRGFKKLEGEGVPTEDALNTTLLSYRSTPIPALGNKAPSELFLGRSLRTTLTMLMPSPEEDEDDSRRSRRNQVEQQFDKKHGSKDRDFEEGERVMVKDYHGMQWNWTTATVLRRLGRVKYRVQLKDRIVMRHANQMRRQETEVPETKDADYWMQIMCDTLYAKPVVQRIPPVAGPLSVPLSPQPDAAPQNVNGTPRQMSPAPQSPIAAPQVPAVAPQPVALQPPQRQSARSRKPTVRYDPSVHFKH